MTKYLAQNVIVKICDSWRSIHMPGGTGSPGETSAEISLTEDTTRNRRSHDWNSKPTLWQHKKLVHSALDPMDDHGTSQWTLLLRLLQTAIWTTICFEFQLCRQLESSWKSDSRLLLQEWCISNASMPSKLNNITPKNANCQLHYVMQLVCDVWVHTSTLNHSYWVYHLSFTLHGLVYILMCDKYK